MNHLALSFACYGSAAIMIAVLWWIAPGVLTAMLAAMFVLALVAGA